jgi:hypothetical protein
MFYLVTSPHRSGQRSKDTLYFLSLGLISFLCDVTVLVGVRTALRRGAFTKSIFRLSLLGLACPLVFALLACCRACWRVNNISTENCLHVRNDLRAHAARPIRKCGKSCMVVLPRSWGALYFLTSSSQNTNFIASCICRGPPSPRGFPFATSGVLVMEPNPELFTVTFGKVKFG